MLSIVDSLARNALSSNIFRLSAETFPPTEIPLFLGLSFPDPRLNGGSSNLFHENGAAATQDRQRLTGPACKRPPPSERKLAAMLALVVDVAARTSVASAL